ncbi:MAG: SCE4755 family polysaccharide monooxygenase-like protein [Myxococcaceae bacterium]|nr:SCE4755 family polysaccharide monooxygenase-like protein [Myxococcaceae bacterium]
MRLLRLLAILLAVPATAHIALRSPTVRYADQKVGPCGRGATDLRTTRVTTFTAGDTIEVVWDETVNHPGYYRISFDLDGQDFYMPRSFTDADGGLNVLVDNIPDAPRPNQRYTMRVRLPDTPCTNCTLQVIQMMTDKPPYGDGNDIYFQCADLVLLPRDAGVLADAGADAGPVDGGSLRPDAGVDAGVDSMEDGGVTFTPIPDAGSEPHQHDDPLPPMGCGCSGSAGSVGLLSLLAAWLARRRG